MGLLIVPKTLVLDTSLLVSMARDFISQDRRPILEKVLLQLDAENVLLVLNLHHAIELLQHENDDTARQRRRFLAYLYTRPQSAWLGAMDGNTFGSVLDIVAAEVRCLLREPTLSPTDLVPLVRSQVLRFGNPPVEQLVAIEEARRVLAVQAARGRKIASLAHATSLQPTGESIGILRNGKYRSSAEVEVEVRRLAPILANELRDGGDRRLADVDETATTFFKNIAAMQLDQTSLNPVDAILTQTGLTSEDYHDEMKLSEAAYLSIFREQMKVVADRLCVPLATLSHLRACQFPTWQIQQALRIRRNKARYVSGSDLTDAYLATSVCYFDYTVVDRRTHEYLNQMKKHKDSNRLHLYQWIKVAKYEELPDKIHQVREQTSR